MMFILIINHLLFKEEEYWLKIFYKILFIDSLFKYILNLS